MNNKTIKIFLLLIILFDFMGIAASITIFPHIFLDKTQSIIPENLSRETRLILLGTCLAIYPMGQFFGSAFFGKLSDKFGRKKILIITLLGTTIGFSLSAISISFLNLTMLLLSRLLTGICAGNVSIAQASLIDISLDDKSKAANISDGQMAMGTAYIVGPIFGGVLANNQISPFFRLITPFWILSLFLGVITIIAIVLYRDTIKNKNITVKINIFESLLGLKKVFRTKGKLKDAILVWSVFCIGWWLFEAYLPTFLFEQFKFNTTNIGHIIAFNGVVFTAFQYTLVKRLMRNNPSSKMFISGALGAGLGVLLSGVIHGIGLLYFSMAIFAAFMAVAIPGIVTYISYLTDSHNQGMIMGVVNSIQAVATVSVMLIGGVLNGVNDHTPVMLGGATIICSGIILFILLRRTNDLNNEA
ncbi:MAG: rane protein of unknown function [Burkholderiales bacterium]|jgi:MFS family permease|nr:rane protein of unknown function [Burkholderiales bacterium]